MLPASARLASLELVVLALGASCAAGSDLQIEQSVAPAAVSPRVPSDGRVVLVTIDGVRWQDVFEGSDPAFDAGAHRTPAELMPRTSALVQARGIALGASVEGCGIVRTAGGANVSMPGYQEIFTGRRSACLDNRCAPVDATVFDEAAARGDAVASIGSWDALAFAVSGGRSSAFVSAGRYWPRPAPVDSATLRSLVEVGWSMSPFPGVGAYRPDDVTAGIALEYFRLAEPPLFHIGLGDTDEYAHRGDYSAYLDAIGRADALIGAIADHLDARGLAATTTVIVTTDHGRNADFRDHGLFHPESGRTFILAFGGGVLARGVACPPRPITLADIAPTIRLLLGLPSDDVPGGGTPIEVFARGR